MMSFWFGLSLVVSVIAFIFFLDDLFIDLVAFVKRLKPKKLNSDELSEMHQRPQKKIAIMIANWHEAEIIERMIQGNLGRIDYTNYTFFLGVYPNDTDTLNAALRLQKKYHRVEVVINTRPGPTSKGQMLNEIVRFIFTHEIQLKQAYDVFLLQDSEDIIHNLSLKLINTEIANYDFIQIPVFSLSSHVLGMVRGTYIDEFSEHHTKDMLVRSYFKAGVPSAGVGTAMARRLVLEILKLQNNDLLKENTLTEDYHLGILSHRLGFRSEFLCGFHEKPNGRDYIATREFFPSKVKTSIRQKTRWTTGISLQGYENLGWSKNKMENYFLWRDRRGLLNAPMLILSYGLFISYVTYFLINKQWPDFMVYGSLLYFIFAINFAFLLIKVLQRMRLVGLVNGFPLSTTVPLKWLVANVINTVATIKATYQFFKAKYLGAEVAWVKTTHELPAQFGLDVDFIEADQPMSQLRPQDWTPSDKNVKEVQQ